MTATRAADTKYLDYYNVVVVVIIVDAGPGLLSGRAQSPVECRRRRCCLGPCHRDLGPKVHKKARREPALLVTSPSSKVGYCCMSCSLG